MMTKTDKISRIGLRAALMDIGIEPAEAAAEARIIFDELTDDPFGVMEREVAERIVERRREGEPLAYIFGTAYFYRECYKVSPEVLIPRSDTEILVDYAIKHIPEGESLLDLCTGSGCIGISTLRNSRGAHATLVDISEGALGIARENAELCGVSDRTEFVKMNVLEALPEGEYFAILSNPPYIKDGVYETLSREVHHEPRIALVGGDDGLDFYRSLLPHLGAHLKPRGFIAFEIGYDQAQALTELGETHGYNIEIIRDMSSNPRVAVLRRSK